jgi:hypothetical protein
MRQGGVHGSGGGDKRMASFLQAGHEPDMRAAVALSHEIPKGGTRSRVLGDIAHNRESQAIGEELLDDLAGNACSQPEEVFAKPLDGDGDEVGVMGARGADHVEGIAFTE